MLRSMTELFVQSARHRYRRRCCGHGKRGSDDIARSLTVVLRMLIVFLVLGERLAAVRQYTQRGAEEERGEPEKVRFVE